MDLFCLFLRNIPFAGDLKLRLENDSLSLEFLGDGFGGGVGELKELGCQVDGNSFFENHFDQPFSELLEGKGTSQGMF